MRSRIYLAPLLRTIVPLVYDIAGRYLVSFAAVVDVYICSAWQAKLASLMFRWRAMAISRLGTTPHP